MRPSSDEEITSRFIGARDAEDRAASLADLVRMAERLSIRTQDVRTAAYTKV